jgi:UDP-N-acetylmuramoylalanine--D-glutamate ligase
VNYEDKKVLIIGIARSGIAAARVLASLGAEVTIADQKSAQELHDGIGALRDWPIKINTGGYPPITQSNFDLVITSPGVPMTAKPLTQAVKNGIPVWSEIELAASLTEGQIIAITGTNGKTTTTALVGQLFTDAGKDVVVGGNIGVPLIQEIPGTTIEHTIVAEVSSFQLEWVHSFKPRVAIITNITPDHLDRHGSMENYINTKAGIFAKQSGDDWTILNYSNDTVRKLADRCKGKVVFFSHQDQLREGIFVKDGWIVARLNQEEQQICQINALKIPGLHNLENALAAVGAGLALGLSKEQICLTLTTFTGVEHRLEPVGEVKGVMYINDSKATNPEAVIKALEAFNQPLILIAGGSTKGSDFSQLAQVIKARVKHLVVLGETAREITQAVENIGFTSIYCVSSLEKAIQKSAELALPGEIVLLSPACASYDMFKNYEERGEVFKKLVLQLA